MEEMKTQELINHIKGIEDYDLISDMQSSLPVKKDVIQEVVRIDFLNFNVMLKNGHIIKAEKTSHWRMHWNFTYNDKTYSTAIRGGAFGLQEEVRKSTMTTLQRFKQAVDETDWYFMMSDDHSVSNSGYAHARKTNELYDQLSKEKQLEARTYYNENKPEKFNKWKEGM